MKHDQILSLFCQFQKKDVNKFNFSFQIHLNTLQQKSYFSISIAYAALALANEVILVFIFFLST